MIKFTKDGALSALNPFLLAKAENGGFVCSKTKVLKMLIYLLLRTCYFLPKTYRANQTLTCMHLYT